jgi:hypothetical protein
MATLTLKKDSMKQGLSLVSIIMGIGITSLLITALAIFVSRGFLVPRFALQKSLVLRDASREIKRITEDIRNAVDPGSGDWLVYGSSTEIEFWSNIDADAEVERVRYFSEGDDLYRGVTQVVGGEYSPENEVVTRVLSSLQNQQAGEPVFEFLLGQAGADAVRISLVVDVESAVNPQPLEVEVAVVVPRQPAYGNPP